MKQRPPSKSGYFGAYGGRFVSESLIPALMELENAFAAFQTDREQRRRLNDLLTHYAGRPTPLTFASRLSDRIGASVWLKREDLMHTGSHKLNNSLGQILLTLMMKKNRVIAETGAGQHGVATATAAAVMGIACDVYMGATDMARQMLNVRRMEMMGARVFPVTTGQATLKDAVNEALRDWVAHVRDTHYIIGSVVGPHPYPYMIRWFQSVIGREAKRQFRSSALGKPDVVIACVGGGSNAAGIFSGFVNDPAVRLIGVEAGGRGGAIGDHSASLTSGRPGILHGALTYVVQTDEGQVAPVHSVSAGLDYPGTGPEHSYLRSTGRAEYTTCSDEDALAACHTLARLEGILPALESSHAIGYLLQNHTKFKHQKVLICLSGRGDKDMDQFVREVKA